MNSGVDDAIEGLHLAFSGEPKPASVDACECCLSKEELEELVTTPLRQLAPEQLSEYASCVTLTAGSEGDFRYLLPRILDISVHGQFSWPDHEQICMNLARGEWLSWPEPLKASIVDLFSAAWESAIANDDGWKADELVCGFALAGIDIHPS